VRVIVAYSRGGEWVAFKLRTTPGTKIRGSVNQFILSKITGLTYQSEIALRLLLCEEQLGAGCAPGGAKSIRRKVRLCGNYLMRLGVKQYPPVSRHTVHQLVSVYTIL
jgi:hypothetical protein